MKKQDPAITLLVHQEHAPIRGNAIASGDDEFDREVEDKIINDLENGDEWAWCTVEVRASFHELHASAFLGCVSTKDEESFKSEGYYEDMVAEATNALADIVGDLQNVEINRR